MIGRRYNLELEVVHDDEPVTVEGEDEAVAGTDAELAVEAGYETGEGGFGEFQGAADVFVGGFGHGQTEVAAFDGAGGRPVFRGVCFEGLFSVGLCFGEVLSEGLCFGGLFAGGLAGGLFEQ